MVDDRERREGEARERGVRGEKTRSFACVSAS